MPNEWYIIVNGKEIGPLSDDGLREMVATRQLTPDDLVRKWQFGDWVPAAKVRCLFQLNAVPTAKAMTTQPSSHPKTITTQLATQSDSLTADDQFGPVSASTNASTRLTPCPDCGRLISKNATSCPNCGRPNVAGSGTALAVKNDNRVSSSAKRPQVRWGLVMGIAFVFTLLALVVAGLEDDPGRRKSGNSTHEPGQSLNRDTQAAINEKVYSRYTDLSVAGDTSGIAMLNAAGLVVTLDEGTQVRVINLGIFTTEIKVESGPHSGRYFIVATEHIDQ
jgi:RNA polymerase subunit RPABC4/transcription elongation factor Spt4